MTKNIKIFAKKKFKRKKHRRGKAKDKRKPKAFKYKSEDISNSETKIKANPEDKIKTFFPQKEFYYENFPESMLNENIPNNEQDINFPNEFDLNTNEPNYEDNLFPQQSQPF